MTIASDAWLHSSRVAAVVNSEETPLVSKRKTFRCDTKHVYKSEAMTKLYSDRENESDSQARLAF